MLEQPGIGVCFSTSPSRVQRADGQEGDEQGRGERRAGRTCPRRARWRARQLYPPRLKMELATRALLSLRIASGRPGRNVDCRGAGGRLHDPASSAPTRALKASLPAGPEGFDRLVARLGASNAPRSPRHWCDQRFQLGLEHPRPGAAARPSRLQASRSLAYRRKPSPRATRSPALRAARSCSAAGRCPAAATAAEYADAQLSRWRHGRCSGRRPG